MTNKDVSDLLDQYKILYDEKYWNAGINDSTLSADNWGTTSSSTGTGNRYGDAYQCYGFSLFMAKVLFGKRIIYENVYAAPNLTNLGDGWILYRNDYSSIALEPGDIIRVGNDNDGHSAVVWKVEDGLLYFTECLGSMSNELHWGGYNNTDVGTSESYIKSIAVYIVKAPKTPITATLNANGGICETNSKQVYNGRTYGALPVPTRTGRTFMGWWDTSTNTECISSTTVAKNTAHTLTAIWGKTYKLTNVASGKCLNINGDNLTSLSPWDNVTLWSDSGSNEQKWILSTDYDSKPIKSVIDRNYGLNIYLDSTYNCNVYQVAGNETDSAVYFTNYGSYYRVGLHNYNRYLTAAGTGDGANVYWATYTESNLQKWVLTEL